MKIGILTHHYVSNYGAFLQAYCLCGAITGLFPDDEVEIVDYINVKHLVINRGGFFRFYRGSETVRSWLQKNRMPGAFARARKLCMRLSRRVYSPAGLNALKYDALVVGSDEVWNYQDDKSYLPVKFGVGIDPSVRLISYAASVGGVKAFADRPKEIDAGLRKFACLSARDENTMRFIGETLGKTAVRVLDPVFLYEIPSGMTERVAALTKEPYMLFYHCAKLGAAARGGVAAYARENGLRMLGAGEYDAMYDAMSQDLSPFEWAELFRNARCVLTGTFHGAVFSIVNRRDFIVCPNNPTRAEKLSSLLNEIGLSDRLSSPDALDLQKLHVAGERYDEAQKIIAQKVRDSKQYLKDAING